MDQEFMKEKPVMPLVISMALPMTFSMLVNALYNIIDSYFVAQISEDAMTALSLVFPLQNLSWSTETAIGRQNSIAWHVVEYAAWSGACNRLYCSYAGILKNVYKADGNYRNGRAVFQYCIFICGAKCGGTLL